MRPVSSGAGEASASHPGSGGCRRDDAILAAIASLALVLHLLTSVVLKVGYGYFIDEFYYIACSKRLAFGYVDHPPFSIWLLALSRALIGDSLAALRLLPALAFGATIFLTGRIARMLGSGRFGQIVSAVSVLVSPIYLLIGGYYSMNAFELLLWTGCTALLVPILQEGDRAGFEAVDKRRWLMIGLLAGIGLEFKHTMFLYVVALGAGLLVSPSRKALRSRHVIFSGLIALAILLPNLIWQVVHGFPSLEFYRNAIVLKNAPQPPVAVVLSQIVLMGPLAFPLWATGLWFCLRRTEFRRYRAFGWSFLLLLLVLIVSRSSRPDRIVAAYPILLAAGGTVVDRIAAAGGTGAAGRLRVRTARASLPAIALGGLIMMPIVTPVLPPSTLSRLLQSTGIHFQVEKGKTARLPQWLADRVGWEERVAEIAKVWDTLPADERRNAVLVGGNYGQAGAMELYGPRHGLHARVISTHNNYFLWGPGPDSIATAVTVLVSKQDLEEAFRDVRQAGLAECEYCMDYQSRVRIYVAREPRLDIRKVWPQLKHYE